MINYAYIIIKLQFIDGYDQKNYVSYIKTKIKYIKITYRVLSLIY